MLFFTGANDSNLPKIKFILEPAMSTLLAGVLAYKHARHLKVVHGHVMTRTTRTVALLQQLGSGDVFVFVGVAGLCSIPFIDLRRRGVYTIHYQTEPVDHCMLMTNMVDELWDYGHHNIDACAREGPRRVIGKGDYCNKAHRASTRVPLQRYVPPGALPSVQVMHAEAQPHLSFMGQTQYNARLRLQCWSNLSVALASRDPRHGQWRYTSRGRRPMVINRELAHAPPPYISMTNRVWSDAEFAQLMGRFSVFLNMHKNCGSAHEPVEVFRVNKLLSAGGLVISERSYPKDEQEFEGIVSFADGMAGVAEEYLRLAHMPKAERETLAGARAARFVARFAPARIFERAGIYARFDELFAASIRDGGSGCVRRFRSEGEALVRLNESTWCDT